MKKDKSKRKTGAYGAIWRAVLSEVGDTQNAQAEALGVAQAAISRKASGTHPPAALERFAVAMAMAALEKAGPRQRKALVARALEIKSEADKAEA